MKYGNLYFYKMLFFDIYASPGIIYVYSDNIFMSTHKTIFSDKRSSVVITEKNNQECILLVVFDIHYEFVEQED